MTSLVLVDTSGWICYFARKGYEEAKKAIGALLDEDRAAGCGPILIELVQGARDQKEKEILKEYFQGIHWLPVQDHHWRGAADMAYELRRKGVTVSAIDALIATLAVDYQCVLLHRDSDFERISKYSPLRTFPLQGRAETRPYRFAFPNPRIFSAWRRQEKYPLDDIGLPPTNPSIGFGDKG